MQSRYPETYAAWQRDPEAFLARGGKGGRLGARTRSHLRCERRRLWPLVSRRALQHVLQRRRPPRRRRTQRPGRDPLRQPRIEYEARDHLRRPEARSLDACCCACRARCRERRPRSPLHADDPGSGLRHACLRAHRRRAFGRLRRLRGEGTRDAARRCATKTRAGRILRHRARPCRRLQAAARSGDRHGEGEARRRHPVSAPAMCGDNGRRSRSRLGATCGERERAGRHNRLRAACRDRSALYPLHIRHDGHSERRRSRHRRAHGDARVVDARALRYEIRRRLVDGVRHRLGRRPFLHRLRAAAARLHVDPLRGQAGRHAGCRRVLARHQRIQGGGLLHGADGVPRDQERRPGRKTFSRATTCRRSGHCFSRANVPIPTRSNGPSSICAYR